MQPTLFYVYMSCTHVHIQVCILVVDHPAYVHINNHCLSTLPFSELQPLHLYKGSVWKCISMKNATRMGRLKKEHVILLQVQCIHTASLFWQTHQEQCHPTHQLSSHVKFTQWANRLESATLVVCICVCVCICLCMCCICTCMLIQGRFSVAVCTSRRCVCLWEQFINLRMSRMDVMLGEHLTQSSRGKINSGNNKNNSLRV